MRSWVKLPSFYIEWWITCPSWHILVFSSTNDSLLESFAGRFPFCPSQGRALMQTTSQVAQESKLINEDLLHKEFLSWSSTLPTGPPNLLVLPLLPYSHGLLGSAWGRKPISTDPFSLPRTPSHTHTQETHCQNLWPLCGEPYLPLSPGDPKSLRKWKVHLPHYLRQTSNTRCSE